MPLPKQFEQPEIKTPETKAPPEIKTEDKEAAPERSGSKPEIAPEQTSSAQASAPTFATQPTYDITKSIEAILEDNIADVYQAMPSDKKAEFQQTGEETARKIAQLMTTASVKVQRILGLIRKWLNIIPGVNSFFLEQEAKIKADRIMELHRTQGGR